MKRIVSACILALFILLWTGCGIEVTNWIDLSDVDEVTEEEPEEELPQ